MAQRQEENRVEDSRPVDDRCSRRDDRLSNRERELRNRERQLKEREMDLRRNSRRGNGVDDRIESRHDSRSRQLADPRCNNDYCDRNLGRPYGLADLGKAYDAGFDDGQKSVEKRAEQEKRENYKNFTFGIYVGVKF